jgi:hypothetical protein
VAIRSISPAHLSDLRPLEQELRLACKHGADDSAATALKKIQSLLKEYGPAHPRLLEARLWYFECLLNRDHVAVAESGFTGIRAKANRDTRLHLEATFLLGVCLLRQRHKDKAKEHFRYVLLHINKIPSAKGRRLLQRTVIEHIEEESLLTELIGTDDDKIVPAKIEAQTILLVTKHEEEIYEAIASALPGKAVYLLQEIRSDAVLQLPSTDRLALPAPEQATQPINLGRRAGSVLKKIAWRAICGSDSPIFQLWSSKAPEIFSAGTLVNAVSTAFHDMRIGIPTLVAGVAAIAMKSSASVFCDWAKPEPIMGARRKGE